VCGVRTLGQLHKWLTGAAQLDDRLDTPSLAPEPAVDPADVVGQSHARFAVDVAAAGAHHRMMTGPPGIGETTRAQRLPGLLPPLSEAESLEVTAIHSVAGLLLGSMPLITRPPFAAPHHTSSVAALVGGGTGLAGLSGQPRECRLHRLTVDVGAVEAPTSTTWNPLFWRRNSACRRLTVMSSPKMSLLGCRPADVTG
jgi:predicted ATPase with chaperone activity